MNINRIVAFAGLASVACISQAVVIYDSIGASTTFTATTGGLPRNRIADSFTALNPGAGFHWRMTSIDFGGWVTGGTQTNVTAEVILWNEWNGAGYAGAGSNVFRNEAGRQTFSLGNLSSSGLRTVTFTTPVDLANFADLGVEIQLKANGVKTDNLAVSLQDAVAAVGSSSNLFYRDANNNEIIETTDGRTITNWTNANAMVRVHADAVPEPASLAILGLGVVALIRRRRK